MYFAANPNNPNSTETGPIAVADGQVEFTDSFKYLGSVITDDLEDSKDIDIRIKTATQAMGALNKYFKCKQVPLEAKRNIYLAIPMNLVLWGVESWGLPEDSLRKLRVFHHRSIQKILNINMYEVEEKKITNKQIQEQIDIAEIDDLIAKRQLNWLGKIARMDENKLPLNVIMLVSRTKTTPLSQDHRPKFTCKSPPESRSRTVPKRNSCRIMGASERPLPMDRKMCQN
eukprot:scaffold10488_cov32-Attheya_sp.AAC.1